MSLLPSFVFTKRVLGSLLMAGALGSALGAAPALAQAQEQRSVAETRIGGQTTRVEVQGAGSAAIRVESSGSAPLVIENRAGPTPGKGDKSSAREHINTDMSGGNWAKASFAGHQFSNVDLSGANLAGADLRNARLVNVNLDKANLTGANLSGAQLLNVSLEGALTQGVIWTDGRRR